MLHFFKEYAKYKHFHFIGIGGIGMSALANILLQNGFKVTGSDIKENPLTKELIKLGATINYYHKASSVKPASVVVYSASIKEDNPELEKAKALGITLISRASLLGSIMSSCYSIAVTGTHGKTTTSSILSNIMYKALLDPLIVIGGTVPFMNNSNVHCGKGKWGVFEACEAYKSLYSYNPTYAIITNIDLDHLDYFSSIEHIKTEFRDFIYRLPFYGHLFVNGDDQNIASITKDYPRQKLTRFGFASSNDIKVSEIEQTTSGTTLEVSYRDKIIPIKSPLYGKHNIYNILAALSASIHININFRSIKEAILTFQNADRRLQHVKDFRGVSVYSDYAHHPIEIKATLDAINQKEKGKRIITIFQPHLFSRTKQFYKEFATSLAASVIVLLLPIYPAREKEIKGVSHLMIRDALEKDCHHQHVISVTSKEDLVSILTKTISPGKDVILVLGAGDVHDIINSIT